MGAYAGESDQGTSFDLPLVRTDSTYDTIIHVVNTTASATTVTIALANQNGTLSPSYVAPLAGWASLDYDPQIDPNVGSGFSGSATVSATSPIAVTGEVLNQAVQENVDGYNEVVGSSTVPSSGTNVAYVPLLPSWSNQNVVPTLYLHNVSATAAAANLTFNWTNPPSRQPTPVATTVAVPGLGETDVNVSQVPGIVGQNFDAATEIQSDQPLGVAADENGNGAGFWSAAPSSSESGTTFYFPRFEYQTGGPQNLVTGLVLMNVASTAQTFTVSVYDEPGNLALQMSIANVPPLGIGKFNYAGVNQNLSLPAGFIGSAVVTSQSAAVVWAAKYNGTISAASVYVTPTGSPAGSSVIVPAVRENAVVIARQPTSTTSTGISIQNPGASTQAYTINYWDSTGALVYAQTMTFPPYAMWYTSQATDPNLPTGFHGSAQIVNATGGPLPIVAAEVDGGSYTPPSTLPPPSPSPSPTPSPTSTLTLTVTASPSPSPSSSPTSSPSPSPSSSPTPTFTSSPTMSPTLSPTSSSSSGPTSSPTMSPTLSPPPGFHVFIPVVVSGAS